MRNHFMKIKTLKPSRSVFDLSHDKLMTGDMGKLYPITALEMSPGDTFKIANEIVVRMQPLNAPILHEISLSTHYFFCPFRILWEEWTDFITGGVDGENGGNTRGEMPSSATPALPRWEPTNTSVGSLWDYFGFPTGVSPAGAFPEDFIRRCYNRIWNEYYRDENLQEEIDETNETILSRNWTKDYFTSALESQQRGVAPAMPLTGLAPVVSSQVSLSGIYSLSGVLPANTTSVTFNTTLSSFQLDEPAQYTAVATGVLIGSMLSSSMYVPKTVSVQFQLTEGSDIATVISPTSFTISGPTSNNPLTISYTCTSLEYTATVADLSKASSFDVKDLRLAFQIQRWLELANRGGVRYTEFLRAFFGVSPRDDRLQRPEYIGGSKQPLIISEVLQTSSTDNEPTPQGYMAGHGISAARTYIGRYTAVEYGILMGVMSIMPKPKYQQGINRQWLRRTKFDFLFPQFTHLSEQAIEEAEIFASSTEAENRKIFGFNEVYDELRYMPSQVCGKMRNEFDYWHLARKFENAPALNSDFITCNPSKRIFAVPSEDGFIISVGNYIRAVRPLPKYGNPTGV